MPIRIYGTLLLVTFFALVDPSVTHAGVFSAFADKVRAIFLAPPETDEDYEVSLTSQTMSLPRSVVVEETSGDDAAGDVVLAESLQATSGPLRVSTEQIDFPLDDTISVYEVKKGDTLITVAKLFNISKNTIMWANDLKSDTITPGDTLVILPMTGIKHTIKKGDTVESIAKKYKADTDDILKFNGISRDTDLALGETVLVPEGEVTVTTTVKAKGGKLVVKEKILDSYSFTTPKGFLLRPLSGGTRTQGLHGHNAVDIAAAPGTSIYASAAGRVIIAKVGGYNGGYGNMIIISHAGGVQTVYSHMRQVNVLSGQDVVQGQVIGEVGNTGRSTGPHLHFEVRGAKNPF